MTLDWIPSFGKSSTSTDPASVAGKEIYGRVRAVYSGTLDADAPDFIIYLGALDSVFSYLGYLKRMYRCISTYTPENVALPDILLKGMGLSDGDITSLRNDKTRFWQGINELILLSRKFKCPAVMDIFNRHYWMSDNVYADAASLRAQLYMFVLAGVYVIDEGAEASSSEPATILQMTSVPRNFTSDAHSVCDTLIEFGRGMINALDAWDDCYTISGYLQRAYDGVQSFAVAELLQGELMSAQYVPEVLAQIENSRSVLPQQVANIQGAYDAMFANVTVTQNVLLNSVVTTTPLTLTLAVANQDLDIAIEAIDAAYPTDPTPLISLRSDSPTVADSVIATRLTAIPIWSRAATADKKVAYTFDYVAGTEVPLAWKLFSAQPIANNTTLKVSATVMAPYYISAATESGSLNSSMDVIDYAFLSQFDWHPIMIAIRAFTTGMPTGGRYAFAVPIGDIHNPTIVTAEMLRNLNTVCLYSEFNSFGL